MKRQAAARALAVLAVAVAVAAPAAPARADGDPASDVLLTQSLFLPADADVATRQEAQLDALLRAAARAGFPIRVAIIPDGYDLGAVEALWGKPRTYATFLGIELSYVYKHPLLVAMPNGLGLNWPGHSTSEAYRLLAKIRIAAGGGGLMDAAQTAVMGIAASAGVRLTAPATAAPAVAPGHAGGGSAASIAIVVAAALVAALGLAFAERRRTRRPTRPRAGAIRPPRPAPVIVLGACFGAAVSALLLALLLPTHGRPASSSQSLESAPFLFAQGTRAAANFHLIDQTGSPVSMAALRGRPVIITFIDPLCRDLCPLAAHVLNQADRDLPPAQRPAIVAVSVDIYADSRADLDEDFSRWGLVPQWHWAVGQPEQLATVWKAYQVGVSVTTKRIAGTLVHYVYHDEIAYIVDSRGYLRALYGWPYDARQVDQTIRSLSAA